MLLIIVAVLAGTLLGLGFLFGASLHAGSVESRRQRINANRRVANDSSYSFFADASA